MSKKIILRQSVKSGVAVVFFFGLGMASINAQTTQTTQPTGKVGINTTNPTETLDVKGKVRIQELYTDNQQTGTNNATFTATNVVTVDNNGVLGKKLLSSIIMPTIPTEPWQVAGGSTQATTNTQNIYQNGKVGIGNYSTNLTMESSFEINGGGSKQLGLINGTNKWDISTEDKSLTFTKRKPENGRIFSVTQDAKLFLGNNLLSEGGSNAKVILDGGNGKIGIGKNSAEYNLDVKGDAKISGLKTTDDNITNGSTTKKYAPAKMVVVDDNGVLGKQDFPTIPTEPWQVAGSSTQANANNQNIYQSGKVGIGSGFNTAKTGEGNTDVTIHSQLEISSTDNGRHLGLINGDLKWDLSAEDTNDGAKAFSITKRHYTKDTDTRNNDQGRVLSLTKDAKLFLGNTLRNNNGDNAKILVDGGEGKVAIGHNNPAEALDVKGKAKIQTIEKQTATTGLDMVVVGTDGVLKKAAIPTGGGSGNGVKNHTGSNDAVQCNAANAGTIHYKEGVTVNGQPTSVMGFCMKTASTSNKYRWFYIFGGAGTTAGSEADAPNFGEGL